MKDGLADVVQVLCGQYLRYFSYNGFCDLYNDNNVEVFNDSLEESNISSKLLGSLQSRFNKVFFSKFDIVWFHQNNSIHIVLYGNWFLSDEGIFIVKYNTKKLLFYNKWNNPNLWCTCLPYKLKNRSSPQGHDLVMDYVISILVRAQTFSVNGVDLLHNWEDFLGWSLLWWFVNGGLYSDKTI